VSTAQLDWRDAQPGRAPVHPFAILQTPQGVVGLRRKEWLLFQILRAGRIVSDAELIATIWPGQVPHDGDVHALRVLVHSLRKALDRSRWVIARHRHRGYQMLRDQIGQTDNVAA
jgi:DNA-binding winged helix-turn-helix (wHTH) protein